MAQVTIYLSDDLAVQIRNRATQEKKTLSSAIADLLRREFRPRTWPEGFAALYGSCRGDLSPPDDPPPEGQDPL